MKKGQLFKEAMVASLLVIVVDLLLSFFPLKFELIKPIKQGFDDFDIYDLRYAGSDKVVAKKDTNITILEIGNTRQEIAAQIRKLASFQPTILAVDAIFYDSSQQETDSLLINSLKKASPIVLASQFDLAEGNPRQTYVRRSFFSKSLPTLPDGFFNFIEGPEDIKRHFSPFMKIGGVKYPSFTTRMLQLLSPARYNQLVARNREVETINYAGNANHYNVVSLDHFFHPSDPASLEDLFRGKIVFLGFIKDQNPEVLEDIHFTPMNSKQSGKSFPDTYGVVIHANILEMLLNGNYINEMPVWLIYCITFVLVFIVNIIYILILSRSHKHNHFFLFLSQIILALILLYLALLIFDWWNYKIDLMPVIIAVVLSFEVFWLYEILALKMKKIFGYETFVHD